MRVNCTMPLFSPSVEDRRISKTNVNIIEGYTPYFPKHYIPKRNLTLRSSQYQRLSSRMMNKIFKHKVLKSSANNRTSLLKLRKRLCINTELPDNGMKSKEVIGYTKNEFKLESFYTILSKPYHVRAETDKKLLESFGLLYFPQYSINKAKFLCNLFFTQEFSQGSRSNY